MAYHAQGCAAACPVQTKLDLRPALFCAFTVAAGDRVAVPSGGSGCVMSVLGQFAIVELIAVEKRKVKVHSLTLVQTSDPECGTQQLGGAVPVNPLMAIINGPAQVSPEGCKPITLDAYQSTTPGPTSKLSYRWSVPAAVLDLVATQYSALDTPILTFYRLPAGKHTFRLEVADAAGKTAQSADFKLTVLAEPSPLLSLTCPAGDCKRLDGSTYEMHVSLHKSITLMLDVEPVSGCQSESEGSDAKAVPPIEWQQLQQMPGSSSLVWKSLEVRNNDSVHTY